MGLMWAPERAGTHPSVPLTHERYCAQCRTDADAGLVRAQRVQVRTRGLVYCATVVELVAMHGAEWFKVRLEEGSTALLPGQRVRLCSGDGRCTCGDAP